MTTGGFRHVPVVGNCKLLGVVSRGDLKGMEIEEHRWQKHGSSYGIDPHRQMCDVVKGQKPLTMPSTATVAEACAAMRRRKAGSALVVDARQRIKGIFTGRDAVRILASRSRNPATVTLARAMTRNPVTLGPECRPIEALRAMCECGFRHVPVADGVGILEQIPITWNRIRLL
jgi:CBS domain-containing protein